MIHLTRTGSGQSRISPPRRCLPHQTDKEVRHVTKYDARIHHQPDTPILRIFGTVHTAAPQVERIRKAISGRQWNC